MSQCCPPIKPSPILRYHPPTVTNAGLVDALQALQARNRLLQGDLDTLKSKYTGGLSRGAHLKIGWAVHGASCQ